MVRELTQSSLTLFGKSWVSELVALLVVLFGRNSYTNIMLFVCVADFSLESKIYQGKNDLELLLIEVWSHLGLIMLRLTLF